MESCGLTCHQYETRMYGKLTCANLAVATLGGKGPPYRGWCTAVDRKTRISSSIWSCDLYTDTMTYCRRDSLLSTVSSSLHQCWKLSCWQIRPLPRRSLQTLQRDRVCFNLLCAFLSFTPHKLTALCLWKPVHFDKVILSVLPKPWERWNERK